MGGGGFFFKYKELSDQLCSTQHNGTLVYSRALRYNKKTNNKSLT